MNTIAKRVFLYLDRYNTISEPEALHNFNMSSKELVSVIDQVRNDYNLPISECEIFPSNHDSFVRYKLEKYER